MEINGKLAALEVRNLSFIRNKIEGLVCPLACIVDYLGVRYLCSSLLPISMNSLVYGSDTQGVIFKNDEERAQNMATRLAGLCNLKGHNIMEGATR